MLLEPSPDGKRIPRGWRPPLPFRIWVRYRSARPPDLLWVTPYLVAPGGRMIYLAAGPAGRPVSPPLIEQIDVRRVPSGIDVHLVSERNTAGEMVYGVPNHTAN